MSSSGGSHKGCSMRRGELWTVLDSGYAAKPRPALIVQPQTPSDLESVILVWGAMGAQPGLGRCSRAG
jgi:hypothetical protein